MLWNSRHVIPSYLSNCSSAWSRLSPVVYAATSSIRQLGLNSCPGDAKGVPIEKS